MANPGGRHYGDRAIPLTRKPSPNGMLPVWSTHLQIYISEWIEDTMIETLTVHLLEHSHDNGFGRSFCVTAMFI